LPSRNHLIVLRIASLAAAPAALLAPAPDAQAAVRLVAPGGSDSGDCRATPCASFARAYRMAASGDVITVAPGDYREQTVPNGSKAVTFRGVPGNKIRQLHSDADNVTFDGLDLDAGGTKTTGAVFEHGAARNVTLKNSRVGNVVDEKGAMLGGSSSTSPTNVVIDNVDFHDVIQQGDAVHNECVMTHAPGITIRNSTFRNCATMDISLGRGDWWGQQPYGSVVLENNVFGHSVNGSGWHHYGLAWFIGSFENARVVNNTFENAVLTADENIGPGPYSGVWANNIGGGWQCLPGVIYRNNVGKKCHASDRAVSPQSSCGPPACSRARTMPVGWLDPAGFDFKLAPRSRAVDAGSAEYATATDKRGLRRDGRPDAGAYEHGASPGDGAAPRPRGGGPRKRWKLASAALRPRTICRRARRGCPASAKLRIRPGRPARVAVRVQRLRDGGKPERVRSPALRKAKRHKPRRIRAKGLPAGRYRVVVTATDANGRRSARERLKLRVR
jgi:hypothetical protein